MRKTWQLQSVKFESQISHHTKVIDEKERKIIELNDKLKKSLDECNNKEIEARTNHKRAVYSEGEVAKLTVLLEKRDATIVVLENKVSQVQHELNIYITMEAKLRAEKESLQSELTTSVSASDKFQADLKIANREIDTLSAKVSDYEHELRRTKDRYEKLQSNKDSLHYSESKIKTKCNELEQENIRMRNKIIELEKDLELARNKPTEKSYEVISVDNVQNVEAGPESGDLFAVDSEELERANHKIKELEGLLHHHEVENSDLQVKLGNSKGKTDKYKFDID